MLDIWEVVEELAATAYERGSKTISESQINKELSSIQQDSPHNVEEIKKSLLDLGYQVGA
jgi:hypothetical protein